MVGVPSRGPCPSRAEEACRDATHRLAPVAVAGVGLGQDSDRHRALAALEQGDLVDEVPERASPPAALEETPKDHNPGLDREAVRCEAQHNLVFARAQPNNVVPTAVGRAEPAFETLQDRAGVRDVAVSRPGDDRFPGDRDRKASARLRGLSSAPPRRAAFPRPCSRASGTRRPSCACAGRSRD
jgi:hypothetical protein